MSQEIVLCKQTWTEVLLYFNRFSLNFDCSLLNFYFLNFLSCFLLYPMCHVWICGVWGGSCKLRRNWGRSRRFNRTASDCQMLRDSPSFVAPSPSHCLTGSAYTNLTKILRGFLWDNNLGILAEADHKSVFCILRISLTGIKIFDLLAGPLLSWEVRPNIQSSF